MTDTEKKNGERETLIKIEMAVRDCSRAEAEAHLDDLSDALRKSKEERVQQYEALNIPLKLHAGAFPFQEDYVEWGDLNDMYEFFKLNDPTIKFGATIEMAGVRFDEYSYRGLSPVLDESLLPAEVETLQAKIEEVKAALMTAGGEMLAAEDGTMFYLRVRGNSETYRELAKLEAVSAITLIGDPSHLQEDRAQERDAKINARLRAPLVPLPSPPGAG